MSVPTSQVDDLRMLRAALLYAERFQLHVFPCYEITPGGDCSCPRDHKGRGEDGHCGNPGKHPRTRTGWKEATTNLDTIKRWWRQAPLSNIGIACGPSDLVVVDVDPRSQGDATLAELERVNGPLPETPRQLTGGGGLHVLYRRPARSDVPNVRGGGHVLGMGVDVKADDGYIIAAPSGHVSGTSYAWEHSARLDEVPIAPLPEWILERLDRRARSKQPASTGAVVDSFFGRTFKLAGWLGRPLGADKAAAYCPWEDEHTGGSRYDGSTLIFAARDGNRLGWWYCAHAHCSGRRADDIMAALPPAIRDQAKRELGLPPDYDGSKERRGAAPAADDDDDDTPPPDGEAWRASLRKVNGRPTKAPGNAMILLSNLPAWDGTLQYDAFADVIRWVRPAPPLVGAVSPVVGDDLADHHLSYVQQWLATTERVNRCDVGLEAVRGALVASARRHAVHPLRDYLTGLTWDGTPRLAAWLHAYLGAADDDYTRAVGTFWMVSAVARVMQPGCQADHLLILEGPQGVGKSQLVRTLAGSWYLGTLPDLRNGKDAAQALQGRWIIELGELDALKGSAATRIKDFLTQPDDVYRPPYGRLTIRQPRQCVFIGTTNEHAYLRDATGARRFWPVAVGQVYRDGLARDRDQLWAEAVTMYHDGAPWWPPSTLESAIQAEQEARFESDEWEGRIRSWLMPDGDEAKYALIGVTTAEVLEQALGITSAKDWGRSEQMRVGIALQRLGWGRPKDDRRRGKSRVWMPCVSLGNH